MEAAKKAAAKKAVTFVKSGMTVGLGTGSTAYWAIQELGSLVQQGYNIKAVASSLASEEEARKASIPIVPFEDVNTIDIYIDGADEVDEQRNLVKGGGGALLREKILAYNSRQFIVIVDESKLVMQLGKAKLPVEIIPFAFELTVRNLTRLGGSATLRKKGETIFTTDNGNHIADCDFGLIPDVNELNDRLHHIPGVVETGLFSNTMVSSIIVGSEDGTTRML